MIEQLTKEAFHAVKGVSYSKLAKLADGPLIYKLSLDQPPAGPGLDFGSVVDALLTSPDTFNDKFYVMTADKPESPMMLTFSEVYARTNDQEEAWRQSGFKIGLDRVMNKFNEEGRHYYDALLAGKDKKIVDASLVMKGNQVVTALKTNPFTKKYFVPESKDVTIQYQVPVIWNIETADLTQNGEAEWKEKDTTTKGIIDIVHIDHLKKLINIIDLKTGSEGFWKSFWKFRYYLQGSMYYEGFKANLPEELKDYTILPTMFIYADANLFNPPTMYRMTMQDILCGKQGYYLVNPKTGEMKLKYKGYDQLAAELNWHTVNDQWDYPYEIYMSGGEVEIDAFKS